MIYVNLVDEPTGTHFVGLHAAVYRAVKKDPGLPIGELLSAVAHEAKLADHPTPAAAALDAVQGMIAASYINLTFDATAPKPQPQRFVVITDASPDAPHAVTSYASAQHAEHIARDLAKTHSVSYLVASVQVIKGFRPTVAVEAFIP